MNTAKSPCSSLEGVGAKAKLAINFPAEMEFVSIISEWEPPRRFA